MHQWAGIKPKVLNQNKMLAQKVTPRSKASTTNHSKTTNQNKALDDEVARAVQQLLTLNKSDETDNNDVLSTSSKGDNAEVYETTRVVSDKIDQENNAFKTPENTTLAPVQETGFRKKSKKSNQLKLIKKRSNLEEELEEFLEYENCADGDGSKPSTPKRPRFDHGSMNNAVGLSTEKALGTSINISKYMKVEGEEGCILSAFYTAGQEEKLKEFVPIYVNIGNRLQAKELIGIRKNTKFVSTNSKTKSKTVDDQANYLVLSFENRKKSNSPFIEYPLNRLDTVINALQELKERVMTAGHYKEQDVYTCKYPENTKIRPGDDKDTILKMML